MSDERHPGPGAFLPASVMYFCSGQPMHYCSGVDTGGLSALMDLKEASVKAADILKASCRSEQPLTPTGRLAALEERLNTVLQALELVQAPLDNFYNSLSDEQKARFNRLGAPSIFFFLSE